MTNHFEHLYTNIISQKLLFSTINPSISQISPKKYDPKDFGDNNRRESKL